MNTNITEKSYKKLSIQVALNGLSFCCFDTLNNTITAFNEIRFDTFHKATKTEDLFADAFSDFPELKESYDEILVIHNNNLSTILTLECSNIRIINDVLFLNIRNYYT